MTRAPISRIAAAAGIVVLAGACTLSDQDPPPLTGPSEFAQSIVIAVSPDVLPQDGASQSFITVTARDANAQPIRNLTMRTETQVNGTPVDFGTLSARNVVTGSDGRATLVYTAPPSPAVAPDDVPPGRHRRYAVWNRLQQQFPADRVDSARAAGQGDPARRSGAGVHHHADRRRSTARPCSSTRRPARERSRSTAGPSAMAASRRVARVSHAFSLPGTYVVTPDARRPLRPNRSRRRSRSPWRPAVSRQPRSSSRRPIRESARASTSTRRPRVHRPGSTIASYTWDFGDGSPRVTTGSPVVSKTYGTAATYTVTLLVTDSSGRTATVSITMQIAP